MPDMANGIPTMSRTNPTTSLASRRDRPNTQPRITAATRSMPTQYSHTDRAASHHARRISETKRVRPARKGSVWRRSVVDQTATTPRNTGNRRKMYFVAAIQPPWASKKKLIIICCSTGTQAIGPAISSASPRQASGSLAMIRSIISALLQIKAHLRGASKKVRRLGLRGFAEVTSGPGAYRRLGSRRRDAPVDPRRHDLSLVELALEILPLGPGRAGRSRRRHREGRSRRRHRERDGRLVGGAAHGDDNRRLLDFAHMTVPWHEVRAPDAPENSRHVPAGLAVRRDAPVDRHCLLAGVVGCEHEGQGGPGAIPQDAPKPGAGPDVFL